MLIRVRFRAPVTIYILSLGGISKMHCTTSLLVSFTSFTFLVLSLFKLLLIVCLFFFLIFSSGFQVTVFIVI